MKPLFRYIILFFLSLNSVSLIAQDTFFLKNKVSKKIPFEFVSNLIVIPVEINGVSLSFVLDTGVSKPILFNLTDRDSLGLKNTKAFYLHGLGGDGKIEALKSSSNRLKVGDAFITNQDLYVVFDSSIDFTPRLGVLIHGIIGYDIFKDFVVEINYTSKYIRLYRPDDFEAKTSKKWRTLPIDIVNNKPYVKANVVITDEEKQVKLLIDTGSSDALWLFENKEKGILPSEDLFFVDYLGKGLSGSVYGKRSKVKRFKFSDFNISDANVAYPDSTSIDASKVFKERNGSLGGHILKRFNLFFDYKNQKLYLRKNSYFKEPFTYNNSGIVLEHNGTMFVKERINVPLPGTHRNNKTLATVKIDLSIRHRMILKPLYQIVELRESSNAYASGLRIGDILIEVNTKKAYDLKLSEINEIFHGKTGKTVRLRIERQGNSMYFKFKLDNAFKKKEPSN